MVLGFINSAMMASAVIFSLNIFRPKYALSSIKRKIGSENPHVSLFALQVRF